MTIIYATQYRQSDKQCVTQSVDSGFQSLDQVVQAFGADNCNANHPRIVLVGDGEDRIAYSDFAFLIDEPGTTG